MTLSICVWWDRNDYHLVLGGTGMTSISVGSDRNDIVN